MLEPVGKVTLLVTRFNWNLLEPIGTAVGTCWKPLEQGGCFVGCFTTKEGKTPKCALVDHCCDWKRQLTGSGDFEDFEDVEIVPVEETDAELQQLQSEVAFNFAAPPLFSEIKNASFHHQFKISKIAGKVVVQARTHAKPRKCWEPKEGVVVLHRLPDDKEMHILQPKPFNDDDMAALQARS